MCHLRFLMLSAVVLGVFCTWSEMNRSASQSAQTSVSTPTSSSDVPYIPDQFGDTFTNFAEVAYSEDSTLTQLGYDFIKVTKGDAAEIEYAVLKRNGVVIAEFGSSLDKLSMVKFGLFRFLYKESRQVIIEQTSNKFWRYWIVNFSPSFEVIYDSGKYDLVYDLRPIDLDGDGQFEVVQHLGTFWYCGLDNIYSPRPPIVLRYNASLRKYLPANHQFQGVMLRDIEQRIAKVREVNRKTNATSPHSELRAGVLDVLIRYLYAGKENEAWDFLERENIALDKENLKAEVAKTLEEDTVYSAIQADPLSKKDAVK